MAWANRNPYGPYTGLGANANGDRANSNPGLQYVPTTGSILVLNFAEVIQLTEEYYAPGSLGSFNLQLQVTVQNNHNDDWNGNAYELVIMVMNSGVFVNERGTSSTFLGLLTKQGVLDALQQQPYSSNEVRRMVGGGFLDNIRSAMGWIQSKFARCQRRAGEHPASIRYYWCERAEGSGLRQGAEALRQQTHVIN